MLNFVDILYDSWSPAMTVSSICISILSMLSSSTVKVWLYYCFQLIPLVYNVYWLNTDYQGHTHHDIDMFALKHYWATFLTSRKWTCLNVILSCMKSKIVYQLELRVLCKKTTVLGFSHIILSFWRIVVNMVSKRQGSVNSELFNE